MFCGGRRCKYESSSAWKKADVAIEGIYSHWITDDLLAMARPNTENMAKYKTVQQFKTLGIKSIINLQTPGTYFTYVHIIHICDNSLNYCSKYVLQRSLNILEVISIL